MKFLLEIDAIDFTRETFPLTNFPNDYGIDGRCLWAPIVEISDTKNPFLSKSIDEYLSDFSNNFANNDVDIFFGYTNAVSCFVICLVLDLFFFVI